MSITTTKTVTREDRVFDCALDRLYASERREFIRADRAYQRANRAIIRAMWMAQDRARSALAAYRGGGG